MTPAEPPRRFLFLQGPISPYFAEVGAGLRALGHQVHRINFCLGDRLFWRGPGATDYRGRAEDWPGFVGAFLDRHGITDLVLLGEQRPLHRAAIAAARARGLAVAVTDFGYLRPDWIVLERDGMGAESRFPRDPEAIRALAAECPPLDTAARYGDDFRAQARWDMLFHLASLLPWPSRHYRSFLLHHPVPAYLGTGLQLLRRKRETRRDAATLEALKARGVPLHLFAMQMETDYSLRAYSDFPDGDAAIAAAVGSFARGAPAEAHLLVKVHPLDPGLKDWRRRVRRIAATAGVEGRVHYLGGALHADPVILACRGVATVNSTLGIRALQLGRPVRVLGRAIYDVPGLAWRGEADAFWREAAPPPDAGLVQDFLRAVAGCLQVRGVFYARPGLDAAVAATVQRLHEGTVGRPVPGWLPRPAPAVPEILRAGLEAPALA